jgi:membrane protein implicated in regulation of membrane protease activity
VFFGSLSGFMIGFGVAAFVAGHPAYGLLAFTGAGLTAVICALVRLNWRILETNRNLLEQNRRLLNERAHDMIRRTQGPE